MISIFTGRRSFFLRLYHGDLPGSSAVFLHQFPVVVRHCWTAVHRSLRVLYKRLAVHAAGYEHTTLFDPCWVLVSFHRLPEDSIPYTTNEAIHIFIFLLMLGVPPAILLIMAAPSCGS
jgi:hypothetical protein